jgi:hypothetical protein
MCQALCLASAVLLNYCLYLNQTVHRLYMSAITGSGMGAAAVSAGGFAGKA